SKKELSKYHKFLAENRGKYKGPDRYRQAKADFDKMQAARQEAQRALQAKELPGDWGKHKWGDASTNPCFPSGTLGHTSNGLTAIESLREGVLVFGSDPGAGDVVERRVVACLRNWTQHLVKLIVSGEAILATRSHPFYDALSAGARTRSSPRIMGYAR